MKEIYSDVINRLWVNTLCVTTVSQYKVKLNIILNCEFRVLYLPI